MVLCTSPLIPCWSKNNDKFSEEPNLKIVDSCGFNSWKSVILLKAHGGTKDEHVWPGDFPQINRTLECQLYTGYTRDNTGHLTRHTDYSREKLSYSKAACIRRFLCKKGGNEMSNVKAYRMEGCRRGRKWLKVSIQSSHLAPCSQLQSGGFSHPEHPLKTEGHTDPPHRVLTTHGHPQW